MPFGNIQRSNPFTANPGSSDAIKDQKIIIKKLLKVR